MPRFHVVTRVVCNKCGRRGPGVFGEHEAFAKAVEKAMLRRWTKRRESSLYAYDYYCPDCSAKMSRPVIGVPIMELSTDH